MEKASKREIAKVEDLSLIIEKGYIASRILSRRACYVMKMNHDAIPALDQLKRFIYERKALKTMSSTDYTWVKYNPLESWFTDMKWFFLGSPIEQLCKHLPLYKAEVVEKPHDAGAHGCVKAGLLGILGISICGGIDV
ncbi:PREDICTED: gastrokine-2 [Myotis davidii]|uniref:gastrokine-2 n=1 Tax=Myotis davidii TaxID=225400 RepID=UPI0003EC39D0|nr:PREDICTED: gastrokine-2 [Myotis davidii]